MNSQNMQLGQIEWITGALALLKSLGWFTQAEWVPELCGDLTNNHSSGKIINALESETGQTFPQLRTMLQEVVDAWRAFQRAWPWQKQATAGAYVEKVNAFGTKLQEEILKYAKEHGIDVAGGIWGWVKDNWPLVAIGAGFATAIGAILILKDR